MQSQCGRTSERAFPSHCHLYLTEPCKRSSVGTYVAYYTTSARPGELLNVDGENRRRLLLNPSRRACRRVALSTPPLALSTVKNYLVNITHHVFTQLVIAMSTSPAHATNSNNWATGSAKSALPDQTENEFRNIKLKLKGPNRHSELQAVKALMAMSSQHNNLCVNLNHPMSKSNSTSNSITYNSDTSTTVRSKEPMDLSRSESPEPVYGLSITMTEEEFRELAEKEGIKDIIGEPICKLCGGLFSGPLGIALHMCPAMKRQTYRCDICGEDKWKTKANLHSHIKWCKKRLNIKTEEHQKPIY